MCKNFGNCLSESQIIADYTDDADCEEIGYQVNITPIFHRFLAVLRRKLKKITKILPKSVN